MDGNVSWGNSVSMDGDVGRILPQQNAPAECPEEHCLSARRKNSSLKSVSSESRFIAIEMVQFEKKVIHSPGHHFSIVHTDTCPSLFTDFLQVRAL